VTIPDHRISQPPTCTARSSAETLRRQLSEGNLLHVKKNKKVLSTPYFPWSLPYLNSFLFFLVCFETKANSFVMWLSVKKYLSYLSINQDSQRFPDSAPSASRGTSLFAVSEAMAVGFWQQQAIAFAVSTTLHIPWWFLSLNLSSCLCLDLGQCTTHHNSLCSSIVFGAIPS